MIPPDVVLSFSYIRGLLSIVRFSWFGSSGSGVSVLFSFVRYTGRSFVAALLRMTASFCCLLSGGSVCLFQRREALPDAKRDKQQNPDHNTLLFHGFPSLYYSSIKRFKIVLLPVSPWAHRQRRNAPLKKPCNTNLGQSTGFAQRSGRCV